MAIANPVSWRPVRSFADASAKLLILRGFARDRHAAIGAFGNFFQPRTLTFAAWAPLLAIAVLVDAALRRWRILGVAAKLFEEGPLDYAFDRHVQKKREPHEPRPDFDEQRVGEHLEHP